jgi:hypothetical protein
VVGKKGQQVIRNTTMIVRTRFADDHRSIVTDAAPVQSFHSRGIVGLVLSEFALIFCCHLAVSWLVSGWRPSQGTAHVGNASYALRGRVLRALFTASRILQFAQFIHSVSYSESDVVLRNRPVEHQTYLARGRSRRAARMEPGGGDGIEPALTRLDSGLCRKDSSGEMFTRFSLKGAERLTDAS